MVKIKVSYQAESELESIKQILKPIMIKCVLAKEQKGAYKKAYILIK